VKIAKNVTYKNNNLKYIVNNATIVMFIMTAYHIANNAESVTINSKINFVINARVAIMNNQIIIFVKNA